eukprot:Skav219390  [mRNA]  locus=scaffold2133:88397:90520:+ [translate_table: standard]
MGSGASASEKAAEASKIKEKDLEDPGRTPGDTVTTNGDLAVTTGGTAKPSLVTREKDATGSKEIVAQLDKDALKTLQSVVNRAAASQGSSSGAKEIKEHNVEVYKALGEIKLADAAPMGIEGMDLCVDKVFKDEQAG